MYGTQEEPRGNRGRNGGPQCLRVKVQCIPLAVCYGAIASANVPAWSCSIDYSDVDCRALIRARISTSTCAALRYARGALRQYAFLKLAQIRTPVQAARLVASLPSRQLGYKRGLVRTCKGVRHQGGFELHPPRL